MNDRLVKVGLAAFALAATLAGVLSTSPVGAQTAAASAPAGGRGERMLGELQKRFAAADANHDGKLSRDEAKAGMPRIAEHFDEIDAAKSGSITMADIERWAAKQRAARRGSGSSQGS